MTTWSPTAQFGIGEKYPYWWGKLGDGGYLPEQVAYKLDCRVLPAPSSDSSQIGFNYRPYSQQWHGNWNNNFDSMAWPRYGRNFHFGYDNAGGAYRAMRFNVIRSPSAILELSDLEPVWSWSPGDVRLPYSLYYNLDVARSTHDGRPNLVFADGHLENRHHTTVKDTEVRWWW